MLQSNKCSFDPSVYKDVPMGMFHCPVCGEMVVAGCKHPDYSLLEKENDNGTST